MGERSSPLREGPWLSGVRPCSLKFPFIFLHPSHRGASGTGPMVPRPVRDFLGINVFLGAAFKQWPWIHGEWIPQLLVPNLVPSTVWPHLLPRPSAGWRQSNLQEALPGNMPSMCVYICMCTRVWIIYKINIPNLLTCAFPVCVQLILYHTYFCCFRIMSFVCWWISLLCQFCTDRKICSRECFSSHTSFNQWYRLYMWRWLSFRQNIKQRWNSETLPFYCFFLMWHGYASSIKALNFFFCSECNFKENFHSC